MKVVVIEGIGGILSFNVLADVIASYKKEFAKHPNIKFYGTDFSSRVTAKGAEAIDKLKSIGMVYLDKDSTEGLATYEALQANVVYIVTPPHTHVPLLYSWLERTVTPEVVLVEKPFSENISEMTALAEYLNARPGLQTKVLAIDSADEFALHGRRLEQIRQHLGTISHIDFFWVHDLSGADINYKTLVPVSNHPNTRMHRFNFLADEKRQVFDALIHFLNPLEQLVDFEKITLDQLKAAQYDACDIAGETFVAAKFRMCDQTTGAEIAARAYAGCGIGGIESLELPAGHMIVLRNAQGAQVRISIDTAQVAFVDENGSVVNHYPMAKMYHTEMYNLFFGNPVMGHSVGHTFTCLQILDQIRAAINTRLEASRLPSYTLGTSNQPAPSLEEVLDCTSALDNEQDQLSSYDLAVLKKIVPSALTKRTYSAVLHEHLSAPAFSAELIKLLTEKMLVSFRDPRHLVLAWTHYTNKQHAEPSLLPLVNIGYFEWDFKAQLDWQIENFLPKLVSLMREWQEFTASSSNNVSTEWKKSFTDKQMQRMAELIPANLLAMFDHKVEPRVAQINTLTMFEQARQTYLSNEVLITIAGLTATAVALTAKLRY